MDAKGLPLGGQWSFDADNRSKYPKNDKPPEITVDRHNSFVEEAKNYVGDYFPNNPGHSDDLIYPIDHVGASIWLDEFLQTRFEKFGTYEDAIVGSEHYLHHSVLTPMLNIGLLSPQQIIHGALEVYLTKEIPLNSFEGFIRQIIGWREFIRIVSMSGRAENNAQEISGASKERSRKVSGKALQESFRSTMWSRR